MNSLHTNTWLLVGNKNGLLWFVCHHWLSCRLHADYFNCLTRKHFRRCPVIIKWNLFYPPHSKLTSFSVLLHFLLFFTAGQVTKLQFLSCPWYFASSTFFISHTISPSCSLIPFLKASFIISFSFSFQFPVPSFFLLFLLPNYHELHFHFHSHLLWRNRHSFRVVQHPRVLQQVWAPQSQPEKVPSVDVSGILWACIKAHKHWRRKGGSVRDLWD